MKQSTVYFVSGVSGAGKTTVMPHLKALLPDNFEIHDFDEGGFPSGADHAWRIGRTREWITLGGKKSSEGITVVICGIANPDEIVVMKNDFPEIEIKTVLLDGDADVIEQRLRGRNQNDAVKADLERVVGSAEDFIKNNTNFLFVLRDMYKKYGYPIVDTTHLEPRAVAERVVAFIK